MKYLIVTLLTITPIIAHSQSKGYISAGPSYNIIESQSATVINSMGYYAGYGLTEKIRKWTVNSELQFLHQRFRNKETSITANSGNILLYTGYQPFRFPVSIYAGVQMGFVLNSQMEGDTIIKHRGPRFGLSGGLSYNITRYEIIGRYHRTVDGSDFVDHTLQLGVNYRLRK